MATTLLFWNIMGNDAATWPRRESSLRRHLARLAANTDLLLLAESRFDPVDLAASLGTGWAAVPSRCRRIQAYSRLPTGAVVERVVDAEADRWAMLGVKYVLPRAMAWTARRTSASAESLRR